MSEINITPENNATDSVQIQEAQPKSVKSRTVGRIGLALFGGLLTLNSFLLQWWLPEQEYAAQFSAIAGAIILACPIVITAIMDLVEGKIHMNELVALAIFAAFAGGDFQIAGVIAFFLLLTIFINSCLLIKPSCTFL